MFVYTADRAQAETAAAVVAEVLEHHELHGVVLIAQWHPVEEVWKDPDEPLPLTPEQQAAEHAALEEREARESAERGAQWEVRIDLASHAEALAVADRLEGEGLAPLRRWKHVFLSVATEDDANAARRAPARRVARRREHRRRGHRRRRVARDAPLRRARRYRELTPERSGGLATTETIRLMLTVEGSGSWKPLHSCVARPGVRQPTRSRSVAGIDTGTCARPCGADLAAQVHGLARVRVARRDVGLRASVVAVAQFQRQAQDDVRRGVDACRSARASACSACPGRACTVVGSAVRIESDRLAAADLVGEHRRLPEVQRAGREDHLVVGVGEQLARHVSAQRAA